MSAEAINYSICAAMAAWVLISKYAGWESRAFYMPVLIGMFVFGVMNSFWIAAP